MSIEWLTEHHTELSPRELAIRAEARQDAADKREAERKRAEAAERREALLVANALNGNPMGEMVAAQRRMAGLQDEVNELRGQLEKAERKLESARSNLRLLADEQLIVEEAAARSAPLSDPAYAALQRAREEHQRMMEHARERTAEVNEHRQRWLARTGQR
jgi:hypothetical protein